MIEFHYEADFRLKDKICYSDWINRIIRSENFHPGKLVFIFCDDDYLLKINQKFLSHNSYTDIITFDYSEGSEISGDIFISVERVRDNAVMYKVGEEEELKRVMAHGVLHLLGYSDKEPDEIAKMRSKEEEKMKLFHVEQ